MAGGAAAATILQPIFTGERRRVNTLASLGIVGDRVYLTPRIRPLDLRLQKMFPFQMKWIWISLNLSSPLGPANLEWRHPWNPERMGLLAPRGRSRPNCL
ncbi:hypothetical protein TcG_08820 [Trypanosoma cruzi]|nr:hypothetical protein TcG_08820 [Trypanosoma cruzi]